MLFIAEEKKEKKVEGNSGTLQQNKKHMNETEQSQELIMIYDNH